MHVFCLHTSVPIGAQLGCLSPCYQRSTGVLCAEKYWSNILFILIILGTCMCVYTHVETLQLQMKVIMVFWET